MCEVFGILPTGETVYKVTLKSGDTTAAVISYGARVISFCPFGHEIVGGFETLSDYVLGGAFHGATVGRVCNRIVGASFTMDGKVYELTKNNGENCLHGGSDPFHNKPWQLLSHSDTEAVFSYLSPDGQSGFPGNLKVTATYKLEGEALYIEYRAVPDKKTPVMITNHAFFNLDSFSGTVMGHKAKIYANEYSEITDKRLPTGRRISVEGTPFDFREPTAIGERIYESPVAYDHNFVLTGEVREELFGDELTCAAVVEGEELRLSAYTNQPGVHFYVLMRVGATAPLYKGGIVQTPFSAFCLEMQIEPNCVNLGRGFIDAGEEYVSKTVYKVDKI